MPGKGNDAVDTVDAKTGEPVKTAPSVEEHPKQGTPGDEPFPPAPERGQRASIDRATGEVHGGGMGAGGGNAGEDYDEDSAAGSGDEPGHAARPLEDAERGPRDKDGETYG